MKKVISILLSLTLFVALLAGCGTDPAVNSDGGVNYPTKNIRVIIPQNAGGDTDVVGRKLADMMQEKLGVSLICENLPGGNTSIGLQAMLDADPDGYTVAFGATNIALIKAAGYGDMDYTWFKGIAGINYDTCIIFSRTDETRWTNVEELVQWAKEHSGELTIGTGTAGGVFHLGAIDFTQQTGIDAVIIPSTGGTGGVATTLLNGDIDVAIISIGGFASYVDNGDMYPMAVMSDERLSFYPDAPTLKECGYDVTCISCRGLVCSPEVPDEIVSILEQTVLECVESDEFTEFMNSMYSVAMPMDSAEYTALLEEENTTFPPLVEAAGLSSN